MYRIHNEIEDHLLQLGSIAPHRRHVPCDLLIHPDALHLELTMKEFECFPHYLAKVYESLLWFLVGSHVPDASDDVRGPTSVGDDHRRERSHLFDVWRLVFEPSQTRLTIVVNRS